MTPCAQPHPTLSTPSVGVDSHPVTGCPHTKTKTKTLDRDLRPEEIAKSENVTNAAGLWKEEAPGSNVGALPFSAGALSSPSGDAA